jgi:hypothetical protein
VEACEASEVDVVHVAVEVVAHQAVVLPPILDQRFARRLLAIARSGYPQHRFCNTCFKTVKKGEQEETDNGDLGANVAAEVRNKSQRKNRKKRAQDAARRRDASAETHEDKVIEVRETELPAQGGKSVKTESALQLSTVSKTKPSTVVSNCRYQSVKMPKVVPTIRENPFKRPISIVVPSPVEGRVSVKKLSKKFKEKGVLIPVEKQVRPHEKRIEKKKQSKDHVNMLDVQGLFDFSSKEGLMFTHITGRDEALVIDCVSDDFDQPITQCPSVLDTRWHDIAGNFLRFGRSFDSDSTNADEDLALQNVTYGIQISPSEYTTQNEDVAVSDASTSPGLITCSISSKTEGSESAQIA